MKMLLLGKTRSVFEQVLPALESEPDVAGRERFSQQLPMAMPRDHFC